MSSSLPAPQESSGAYRTQTKPFYTQRRLVILAALFALGLVGACADEPFSESETGQIVLPTYTDEQYAAVLGQMTIKNDTVIGSRLIIPKSSPRYATQDEFSIYISGTQTSIGGLRFLARYSGSDWVFFEKIIVNVDGRVFNLDFSNSDVKRDKGDSGVWEWIDVVPSSENIAMLKLIADSKSTTVRFQGDVYKDDRELTSTEKRAISDIFTVLDGFRQGKLSW